MHDPLPGKSSGDGWGEGDEEPLGERNYYFLWSVKVGMEGRSCCCSVLPGGVHVMCKYDAQWCMAGSGVRSLAESTQLPASRAGEFVWKSVGHFLFQWTTLQNACKLKS